MKRAFLCALLLLFSALQFSCGSSPKNNGGNDDDGRLNELDDSTSVITTDLNNGLLIQNSYSSVTSSWNFVIIDSNVHSAPIVDPDSDDIYYTKEGVGLIKTTLANTSNYTVISALSEYEFDIDFDSNKLYQFVTTYNGVPKVIVSMDLDGSDVEFVATLNMKNEYFSDLYFRYDSKNDLIVYIDSNQSGGADFYTLNLSTKALTTVRSLDDIWINTFDIVDGIAYYFVVEDAFSVGGTKLEKWTVSSGEFETILSGGDVASTEPMALAYDSVSKRFYYYITYYDDDGDNYIASLDKNGENRIIHNDDIPEFTDSFGFSRKSYWTYGAKFIR